MLGTTILLAFNEIRRHLMRSFLTTLGIVIGVSAVVTMVQLGNGATEAVKQQISSLGANILQVRPGQGFGRGGGGPQPPSFKETDLKAIQSQIAGVRAAAPVAQTSVTAVHNASNWKTTVTGTTSDYFVAQQWKLASGRTWTTAEQSAGKSVCLIGETVRKNLFANENAAGSRLRIGSISCDVIGVLASKGQGGFQDQDDTVIVPIRMVQRRFTGNRDISAIVIAVDDRYDGTAIQTSVSQLLRERRNIAAGEEDNFNIFDTRQISETMSGTTTILTMVMAAVAAVSLIVGGIGIMNIMLVSVTERTREIGIRLAVGAVGREVLLQFLVEAIVLSCLGGLIGLALGVVMTLIGASLISVPVVFSPSINLLAFAFSAAIGVAFGYFPARRAASLNPIDALRHE
ncbi:MAG TPA: ABC transporter permease [Novosphingobium sp.]|nr:ABC transporter permease [Novosphingobium sp.]HQA17765.1 ABC transporter permease [Novosphingobium sp.]